MTTTVNKGEKYTNFLPAGKKATFVTAANSTATVKRFDNGSTELDSNSMSASGTLTLGPYLIDCRYEAECLTGSMTAANSDITERQFLMASDLVSSLTTVGAAVLSTAQVSNLTTTQLTVLCSNMDAIVNKLSALDAGTGY